MTLDLKLEARIGFYDSGDLGQAFAGLGLQGVFIEVEKHIGHADDQTARCVAGLQHLIELFPKAGAHLFFFLNSLLSLLLRLLRLLLRLLALHLGLLPLLFGLRHLVLRVL